SFSSKKFVQRERNHSPAGRRAGRKQYHVGQTCRTHTITLLLSFLVVRSLFPGTPPNGRAILPRICDILRPTAQPVSVASPLTSFHARVRNAGAEAVPLSPARANVLKRPATTWRAAGPGASRTYRRAPGGPGSGGGSGPPTRQMCDSGLLANI